MRAIKFRFWQPSTNQMLNWNDYIEYGIFEMFKNDDSIPLQFTGLHDKNGKEIYEGDIVKRVSFDSDDIPSIHIGIIKWDNCSFYSHSIKNELSRGFSEIKGVTYEILGNIYENPELLKD